MKCIKCKLPSSKFKVWDNKKKEWLAQCGVHIDGNGYLYRNFGGECEFLEQERYIISWSTGYKSLNGEEVYEGDFILLKSYNDYDKELQEYTAMVQFDTDRFGWQPFCDPGVQSGKIWICQSDGEIVRGNIFENPNYEDLPGDPAERHMCYPCRYTEAMNESMK